MKSDFADCEGAFLIKDTDNDKAYFGGNQSWFMRNTQAHSGCGHIAALNSFLQLTNSFPIDKASYMKYMNEMYKTMGAFEVPIFRRIYDMNKSARVFKVIPPSFGQSTMGFIMGMLRFSKHHALNLKCHVCPSFLHSRSSGLRFIKKGLKENGAVTLLTARNRHPLTVYSENTSIKSKPEEVKRGMKNHFVTITGIDESTGKLRLIVSTWGRIATIDYDALVRSWHRPGALLSSMVYFSRK